MVHWSGVMPCDRRSHQHMQSLQNVRKLNGMCVGVVFGACHEPVAGQEGWKCLLLVGPTHGARESGPCVLHIRFAPAPELADACLSVHPVVALWPMASGPKVRCPAEQDVSCEISGPLSSQRMLLCVLKMTK
jgi:hypothetical protein